MRFAIKFDDNLSNLPAKFTGNRHLPASGSVIISTTSRQPSNLTNYLDYLRYAPLLKLLSYTRQRVQRCAIKPH
ncbi:Uncharacterised protein [Mycobacteroides abscessus]|nr:hypothetical protein B9M80_09025 [Mycobacteroides abscessus]SHQ40592.1 Uncharacterised protein [Mycobacteroides abscessus subsp. abscessus]CPU52883.1 Uncharacterised protein [Mycobacteroides abscessus]CPU60450.1 Uncharacterised protein [Mycobacteroides abscessus]CPU62243.1 Uncharacterised protein [Mycobacteroides abscessus]